MILQRSPAGNIVQMVEGLATANVTAGGATSLGAVVGWTKLVNGPIRGFVQSAIAFAAGESLLIEIIALSPFSNIGSLTLNAASLVNTPIAIPFSQALYNAVVTSSLIAQVNTYVAGGGPANPSVYVYIQIEGAALFPNILPI